MASKTTTVRPKTVTFQQMQIENDFVPIGNLNFQMEDQATINITGTVAHINDVVAIDKFDQTAQKRLTINEQNFVVADSTGSVVAFVLGELVNKVSNTHL